MVRKDTFTFGFGVGAGLLMRGTWAAATAGFLWGGLALHAVHADEAGKFTMLVTATRDYAVIRHAEGSVFGGGLYVVATVLTSTGNPFERNSHFYMACVVYGKTSQEGLALETSCRGTDAEKDDDRFYTSGGRRAGTMGPGGGGTGKVEIVGGKGRFAGVAGTCLYDAVYLADNQTVTSIDCAWSRPGK